MRKDGELTYLHTDHLGSASLTTDATGGVANEMRYYAYGGTRSGTMDTDRLYTGQRWEAGIGLYDYNARYYDPALGRFVQADSVVPSSHNSQSFNRYLYTLGNPLKYTDPTGHIIKEHTILGLGGSADQAQPSSGITQEQHNRLLLIRNVALSINERTQLALDDPLFLSDADAAALLFDTLSPLYRITGDIYDYDAFVTETGIVIGGVVSGETPFLGLVRTGLESLAQGRGMRQSLNDVAGEASQTIGGNHRLTQYYIGYNNFRRREDGYTGFRQDIAQPGENQVRHFFGGLVGGYAYWGLGASYQLNQERELYDKNMYQEAHILTYSMATGAVPLNEAGNYIRRHLTVDKNDD
jgi:RHS repeat-associated protein